MEIHQFSDVPAEDNNNNVWKLFRETQRNILYLNKQRLMAVEEMKKAKDENQLLLDRVKELEVQLDNVGKSPLNISEKSSICSMLLLRIDAMVLTGMIATKEASELRRLVIHHKVGIADVFVDIRHTRDAELLVELRNFSNNVTQIGFHIVHICTEMAPVASVGSLALYVTGLSRALQEKGNLVEVILPKYSSLDLDGIQGLQDIEAEFYSYFNGNWHGNRIWTGVVRGIGVTFIEPMNNSSFFNRDMIYGYSDDFERFSYFSRASLDYILKSGKHPDVLHIHNSETAVVGPLFWDIFVNQGLGSTRILFTCHDFKTQYLEQPEKLALCGLDPSRLHQHDRLQDSNKQYLVNILKGGIVYSNKVVLMSSIHSKGRIMSSMSHGLESTLAIHKEKLLVAPYGYDSTVWDPSRDKFIPAKYSANDIKGKAICKVALRQRLALPGDISTVTVGCICAEVSDTDLEKLTVAIQLTSQKKAQFIFMGASSILSVHTALQLLQKKLEDEDVKFLTKYDEALSHLLLAGADIILCQSFHDPVHQMPLKALKYGSAPVVMSSNHDMLRHAVVHDFESTKSSEYISSIFGNMSLGEALDQIRRNPSQWNQKIKDGMEKDFSWGAECYDVHLAAYTSITNL